MSSFMQQNGVIESRVAGAHCSGAYHRESPVINTFVSSLRWRSRLVLHRSFRSDTGATLVIPGSHHAEQFPSADVAASLEVSVDAEPGSFCCLTRCCFIAPVENRSGRIRRAVNNVFTVPVIAQQISLPPP
jgi:ectoine hydroxylase-related dioxygenase (phytanoyl-CoA dioxygenase family)